MNLSSNTILITGATSGIGLALAERFESAGSKVLICGRRKERLDEIKKSHPNMEVFVCDVGVESEREALYEWAMKTAPGLNMLINNAGIQRRIEIPPKEKWSETEAEIRINLIAAIHLSFLFTPELEKQKNAAIINVSSGLAFSPMAMAPIYCATKAALHSFTLSLRHALSKKNINVVEIIPPAVNTDLGGVGLHTTATPLNEFADAVMKQLAEGKKEVTYGYSEKISRASREEIDVTFARMNQ